MKGIMKNALFYQAILCLLVVQVKAELLPISKTKLELIRQIMQYNSLMDGSNDSDPQAVLDITNEIDTQVDVDTSDEDEVDTQDDVDTSDEDEVKTLSYYSSGVQDGVPLDAALLVQDGSKCIVTFQGATSRHDDFFGRSYNFGAQTIGPNGGKDRCRVRRAFAQAYMEASYKDTLEEEIATCMAKGLFQELYLTGHGQGGAIALIAAIFLESYKPTAVITGASPAILEEDGCEKILEPERVWNFVNTEYDLGTPFVRTTHVDYDAVPYFPVWARAYASRVFGPWGMFLFPLRVFGGVKGTLDVVLLALGVDLDSVYPYYEFLDYVVTTGQISSWRAIISEDTKPEEVIGYQPGTMIVLPPGDDSAEDIQASQVAVMEKPEDFPTPTYDEIDVYDLISGGPLGGTLNIEAGEFSENFSPGTAHDAVQYIKKIDYLIASGSEPLDTLGWAGTTSCSHDVTCNGQCIRGACSSGQYQENCFADDDCESKVCDVGILDSLGGVCAHFGD